MISSAQIARWAATAEAQRTLPKLVRRLVNLTATTTKLTMPSGESTSEPGWDGEVHSPQGNAWVPAGYSCWEVSCEAAVTGKANHDYKTRTEAHPSEFRSKRVFAFVTPRKWRNKGKWVEWKRSENAWLDVRAYDADDLEQWLEGSPALALAFAEELQLGGPGVESLKTYLSKWLSQTSPSLTQEALLAGRAEHAERILKKIDAVRPDARPDPVSLKADSVEEATAFVAAAIVARDDLADSGVVITHGDGWRFVEKNEQIRFAIAATPEIAERPPVRNGLVVVVPFASGDMSRQFQGVAGRLDEDDLHLERPDYKEFEEALQQIGIEENDSHRLSVQCGRSWSVFRRQHATNPAIRRPRWLDHPSSSALAPVCLLGSWAGGKEADKELVEKVGGRPYAELEAELIELARLDDAPILHIGEVWKAKAPLELLALFGNRLSEDQFDRFFSVCETVLAAPDPQLELPDEDRYAAAIYGKVRPVSGLILDALCDTLIKLAVRGQEMPALANKNVALRVDRLVANLLRDADETRWMSLSSQLRALAEASPDEFLGAVESSLAAPGAPVTRLLSESRTGAMGRCWHAGLLWALEMLGWAPQRLTRVSLILAKLTEAKIEGNWGNTPLNSLLDLYRSWFPQTAASINQRIAALDVLIERTPDAAFLLLDKLANVGHDTASPSARPKWRDDDAGAGRGVTYGEHNEMLVAAADRQIAMAKGHAERVAALIPKLAAFDQVRIDRILALLAELAEASDEDKETLRSALRQKISWHRNYGDSDVDKLDAFLRPLEEAYEALEPDDLVVRYSWLVSDSWPQLPVRTRNGDHRARQSLADQMRNEALAKIWAARGWSGLEEFAKRAKAGWRVGLGVPSLGLDTAEIARWLTEGAGDLQVGDELTSVAAGVLTALKDEARDLLLDQTLSAAEQSGLGVNWKVRLLTLCPDGPPIWRRVEGWAEEANRLYWETCRAQFWLEDSPDDLRLAIRKLMDVRRGATAFDVLHGKFATLEPELLLEVLEAISTSVASDLNRINAYWIQQAFVHLEKMPELDTARMARLEFALFGVFGYEGEEQAASLYFELMSKPSTLLELLCLVYKPANGEPREADVATKAAANMAWRVLHACKQQPGAARNGTIDPEAFAAFIAEARALAQEQDRLAVCDITLGEILAHAPDGADGIWPFEPARIALESTPGDDMLSGFTTGIFNKRGVHSRGVFDGGGQERELAAYFRGHAEALEISYPRLAAALHRQAKCYDRHGELEDLEVKLRREGH